MTDDAEYEMVLPFVACKSKGGAFDDQSFVAGYETANINAALNGIAPVGGTFTRYIYPPLVPQLDLIAMRHHYSMEVGDEMDGWVRVTFGPLTEDEP